MPVPSGNLDVIIAGWHLLTATAAVAPQPKEFRTSYKSKTNWKE